MRQCFIICLMMALPLLSCHRAGGESGTQHDTETITTAQSDSLSEPRETDTGVLFPGDTVQSGDSGGEIDTDSSTGSSGTDSFDPKDICPGYWTGENCDVCPENFDLSSACTRCLGNFDIMSSCQTCLHYWQGTACDQCPSNFNERENCSVCANLWEGEQCEVCPENVIPDQCNECTDGWKGKRCTEFRAEIVNNVTPFTSAALALTPEGLPVLAFQREDSVLVLVQCEDVHCMEHRSIVIDEDRVNGHIEVQVGSDGLPIISYMGGENAVFRVAHCESATCVDVTITEIDADVNINRVHAMEIGHDGLPYLAYDGYDGGDEVRVARCGNVYCSDVSIQIVDAEEILGADTGAGISLVVGNNGFPTVASIDANNGHVTTVQCLDALCADREKTTHQNLFAKGRTALWRDGEEILVAFSTEANVTGIYACANISCDALALQAEFDGFIRDVALDDKGNVAIVYAPFGYVSAGDLKFAICDNGRCTGDLVHIAIETALTCNQWSSIAVDKNGDIRAAYGTVGPNHFYLYGTTEGLESYLE